MAVVDSRDVKLGFWIALGFFLFGLALAAVQWGWTKVARK